MCRTIEVAKDKVGGEGETRMRRLDPLCLRSLDPSGSEAFRGGPPPGTQRQNVLFRESEMGKGELRKGREGAATLLVSARKRTNHGR